MNYDNKKDHRSPDYLPGPTPQSSRGTGSSGQHVLNLGRSVVRGIESVRPVVMTDLKRPVGFISVASLLLALAAGVYLGIQHGEKGMCDCRTVCPPTQNR